MIFMYIFFGIFLFKFIYKKKYKVFYCFNNLLDFCIFFFRKFLKIFDIEDYKIKYFVLFFYFIFDFIMKFQIVLFLVIMFVMLLIFIEVEGNLGDKVILVKGNVELVI